MYIFLTVKIFVWEQDSKISQAIVFPQKHWNNIQIKYV